MLLQQNLSCLFSFKQIFLLNFHSSVSTINVQFFHYSYSSILGHIWFFSHQFVWGFLLNKSLEQSTTKTAKINQRSAVDVFVREKNKINGEFQSKVKCIQWSNGEDVVVVVTAVILVLKRWCTAFFFGFCYENLIRFKILESTTCVFHGSH